MVKLETSFLERQEMKPLVWIRYSFLEELDRYNSYLKCTYDSSKKSMPFLYLKMRLSNADLSTDLHIKSTDTRFYITHCLMLIIPNAPLLQ